VAVLAESMILLHLSITRRPDYILAYLLFPHGLVGYLVAKITRRRFIPSLIAGRIEIELPFRGFFRRRSGILSGFFTHMLKDSFAVTTTGTVTKAFLCRRGVEASKIHPIINPPDLSRVKPADLPKVYDVLVVARLSPEKNLETFIQAVAMVRVSFRDVKVCIVGDGPLRGNLMRLADKLSLRECIDFVGYQRDVAHFFNSAKVFVLTSRREGFPNVFLEAMACRLPCVVSDCGDILDLAEDGTNSLVVQDPDDAAGFAKAIESLLADSGLRERLSKGALETMRHLSVDKVATEWECILGKAVARD
jgi:glycosyltransferase involved in cell wall biosynthesis